MHNQPTPTPISPFAAGMLAVAVLSGTALAGLVVAQVVAPVHVYLGAPVLLGVVATLAGGAFLTHLALDRVTRRLDELDALVTAQRVAYLPPSPKSSDVRHLRAVGDSAYAGITPESIAAARALARRIVDGPTGTASDAE